MEWLVYTHVKFSFDISPRSTRDTQKSKTHRTVCGRHTRLVDTAPAD